MLGAAASTPVTEDHDEKWGVPSLSELGEIKVQYFLWGNIVPKNIFFISLMHHRFRHEQPSPRGLDRRGDGGPPEAGEAPGEKSKLSFDGKHRLKQLFCSQKSAFFPFSGESRFSLWALFLFCQGLDRLLRPPQDDVAVPPGLHHRPQPLPQVRLPLRQAVLPRAGGPLQKGEGEKVFFPASIHFNQLLLLLLMMILLMLLSSLMLLMLLLLLQMMMI